MNLLDLFSGIGGFHLGLEQAGFKFDWVGVSEIDKYAIKQYKRRFPDAEELGDIKSIQPERLPDIDLVTFGFPCQDLSIAGKRGGLQANRSSLFFEAMRIIGAKKPKFFIFENVKGLFSSNEGQDFDLILRTISDFGYDGGWQLLNTRWFLPQNRERVYFVGHIRGEPRPKVFPIGGDGGKNNNEQQGRYKWLGYSRDADGKKTYHENKVANCIKPPTASQAGYVVDMIQAFTEKSFDGKRGDGGRAIRHHKKLGESPCLSSQMGMGGNNVPMFEVKPVLTPERAEKRQNGRRFKDDGEDMFTLTSQDQHGVMEGSNIRRLTPTECERLQGFPDGWTEGQSDTQRYKQLGNADSVPVVRAVGERLIKNIP